MVGILKRKLFGLIITQFDEDLGCFGTNIVKRSSCSWSLFHTNHIVWYCILFCLKISLLPWRDTPGVQWCCGMWQCNLKRKKWSSVSQENVAQIIILFPPASCFSTLYLVSSLPHDNNTHTIFHPTYWGGSKTYQTK